MRVRLLHPHLGVFMEDVAQKLANAANALLIISSKLETASDIAQSEIVREVFEQIETILLLTKDIRSEQESTPSNLDQHILDNAWLLTKSSLILLRNLRNSKEMENARVESDETYENITTAFVAVLNLMDYQAPSWYPVKREHLNNGVEVVVSGNYVLRGYVAFGAEPPTDLHFFPQIR